MKATIIASVLCALPFLVEAGSLSHGNGHNRNLLTFRRHESHKRHAAWSPQQRQTMIRKSKRSLYARKTPGTGDSTTQPDNIAKGTYTAEQGCAIWHTAQDGEVCLGLIDKSSKDFDLAKFIEFNPSVGENCQNLNVGQAYCVDTVTSAATSSSKGSSPSPKPASSEPPVASKQLNVKEADAPAAAPQADASLEDEEDCEEEDNSAAEDEEDCEEDDGESSDNSQGPAQSAPAPSNDQASANNGSSGQDQSGQQNEPAPAPQENQSVPAPKEAASQPAPQPEQMKPEEPKPAPEPSSTYVEPSSEPAPSPEPSPEPAPEPKKEENSGNNGGNNGGSWQYTNQPATYYLQNGNAGSCGDYNSDDALIVAIKSGIMGSDLCGKSIKLKNSATGQEITAKVADTCPTCTGGAGIDLSRGAFLALGPKDGLATGMFDVDYSIL